METANDLDSRSRATRTRGALDDHHDRAACRHHDHHDETCAACLIAAGHAVDVTSAYLVRGRLLG